MVLLLMSLGSNPILLTHQLQQRMEIPKKLLVISAIKRRKDSGCWGQLRVYHRRFEWKSDVI